MRTGFALFLGFIFVLVQGCTSAPATIPAPAPSWTTTASGLGVLDLQPGQGAPPRAGQSCVVHVQGWVENQGEKGRVFLDTRKLGFPQRFPFGVGRVIKGWDEGLATMKPGGKRLLRVPPALGYSKAELGHDIPEGATLLFELELLEIR